MVKILSLTKLKSEISKKSFYNADEAEFLWNNNGKNKIILYIGTSLLILTRTDIDKTGKSYYGSRIIIIKILIKILVYIFYPLLEILIEKYR